MFHFLKTNELGTVQVMCSKQSSCTVNTCHHLDYETSFPLGLENTMWPPLLLKVSRYAALPQFKEHFASVTCVALYISESFSPQTPVKLFILRLKVCCKSLIVSISLPNPLLSSD